MRNTSVVIDKIYEYTSIYIYKYNIHIFIYMCGGVYIYTHIYKTYMCIYIYKNKSWTKDLHKENCKHTWDIEEDMNKLRA